MDQENFILSRNKWLEEVSNQCHEFALKCDLDFYVFQTPCNIYNPKLLIIGINPGGSKTYTEMLKCKDYDKRPATDLGPDINTLIAKPDWETETGNDKMRTNFSKVFTEENKLRSSLESAVMMNMFYFNTPKETDINLIDIEIIDYCLNKTLEFIDILNPQNILFLTSKEASLKKCKIKNIVRIGNNVTKAELNNRIVFAIPHYGYYGAYSNGKSYTMGKTLSENLQI